MKRITSCFATPIRFSGRKSSASIELERSTTSMIATPSRSSSTRSKTRWGLTSASTTRARASERHPGDQYHHT